MAYRINDQILDRCNHCGKEFIIRDDKNNIWNPESTVPVGICAEDDFAYCEKCKIKLIKMIKKFNNAKKSTTPKKAGHNS